MKSFKDILLEKLKVSTKNSLGDTSYIDSLEPGSREKAEEILIVFQDRYGWLFDVDSMRILRTNNIQLGAFNDNNAHGIYGNHMFTFYLNNPEYIIRRQELWNGKPSGTPSKLVEGFTTLEETLNKFDSLLKKRGYLK